MKADINRHFLRLLATFLRVIIIAIEGAENVHPFSGHRIIEKKILHPKANDQLKKTSIRKIFYPNQIQKVLMKFDEMADVFLNLANF